VIYVVLGMHKSGTTLVARLLHASGISMGEFDDRLGYREGNRCERHAAQEANRALLHGFQIPPLDYLMRRHRNRPVDAAGYAINRDSQAYVLHRALARRLARPDAAERVRPVIARCQELHEEWGFKDPRTCLTYPAWRKELPEHRIVAVHRGLGQVLERSQANERHPLRALRVAHAWCVYNDSILRVLEAGGPPRIVLRYERLMEDGDELERLARFVGRPLKDAREPGLYRARQAAATPVWIRALSPLFPASPAEIEARFARFAP
jgi:hypothetical protein